MCYKQNSLVFGGVGQFEPRFQGEEVVPTEYFVVSRKLDTFCYLTVQTAPAMCSSLLVLTQYQYVTDIQKDRRTELL